MIAGVVLLLATATAHAQRGAEPLAANYRGWDYIVDKLVADGVDPHQVRRVFTDPRVEPFTGLQFNLYPREPHSLYQGFTRPSSVAACAIRAKSIASCTLAEHSIAQPVERTAITSE